MLLTGAAAAMWARGLAVQMVGAGCQYTFTPFHVDWYVNQQNLRLRGLRNFRIDPPQTLCCRGR